MTLLASNSSAMMPIANKVSTGSGRAQKPSSARPTQLNANSEKATTATEAKAAIVFTDGMTRTLWKQPSNSIQQLVLENGEKLPGTKKEAAVAALQHRALLARKNPQSLPLVRNRIGNPAHVSFGERGRQKAPFSFCRGC